jgi:glycogen debranching enzyme
VNDQQHTYPVDPLVERNPFRDRTWHAPQPRSFGEARSRLPEPLLTDHPDWVEMYWRAWEIAWGNISRPRTLSGLISSYIDAGRGDHVFMWDSAFMMLFGLYGRRAFHFMGTLDNFYGRQHRDGFICRQVDVESGQDFFQRYDPNSAGPNILAWAEWLFFRATGDSSRLRDVFWPLVAYHHWMRRHRSWPNGLYWATGMSSGMGNQERIPDSFSHHQHWAWVDANLQAALNCHILEQMAELLTEPEVGQTMAAERIRLTNAINNTLWRKDMQFYVDAGPDGEQGEDKSAAAYWALHTPGLLSDDRLEPFIQQLREATMFNRPTPIPALSADSPHYHPDGLQWQGGVWSPLICMVLKGLRQAGQDALAHRLAMRHLGQVAEVFTHTDTFWDHYSPESAAPGIDALPNFVGWTGLTPITILLEFVIGIHVDWPLRRVTWERRLDTESVYGVKHYPLGDEGWMDLTGDNERVTVSSNLPLTLIIARQEGRIQLAVPAGATEIPLT